MPVTLSDPLHMAGGRVNIYVEKTCLIQIQSLAAALVWIRSAPSGDNQNTTKHAKKVLMSKGSHGHFLKFCRPPFQAQNNFFLTTKICRHSPLRTCVSGCSCLVRHSSRRCTSIGTRMCQRARSSGFVNMSNFSSKNSNGRLCVKTCFPRSRSRSACSRLSLLQAFFNLQGLPRFCHTLPVTCGSFRRSLTT